MVGKDLWESFVEGLFGDQNTLDLNEAVQTTVSYCVVDTIGSKNAFNSKSFKQLLSGHQKVNFQEIDFSKGLGRYDADLLVLVNRTGKQMPYMFVSSKAFERHDDQTIKNALAAATRVANSVLYEKD